MAASLQKRAEELESVRELRIVGPDTDLVVGVEGRKWLAADGRYNMPDGEVFTSPLETETRGEIRYAFPAIYHGREVEDVRLRFADGRVVAAEAARGDEYLSSLLDMDDGARILGEVAFGLNYEIDRFTRNILFDEKIGGTMHFALGSGFPQTGGGNTSGLHWDMICDLARTARCTPTESSCGKKAGSSTSRSGISPRSRSRPPSVVDAESAVWPMSSSTTRRA